MSYERKTENGVDKDVAIVVCNRLPDAGPPDAVEKPEVHTALLVSLEQRSELFTAGHYSNPNASTALIVLHHWTFTPSKGGDFEQVMQAIGYDPTEEYFASAIFRKSLCRDNRHFPGRLMRC